MDAGICPVCLGHAGGTLATDPPAVTFACARCGMHAGTGVQGVVLDHPAVVAFHHDRGVDLRTEPLWTLDWLFDPGSLTVFETDPPRVRVTVALGGDELACEVDETCLRANLMGVLHAVMPRPVFSRGWSKQSVHTRSSPSSP
jgi:hypothetical protein